MNVASAVICTRIAQSRLPSYKGCNSNVYQAGFTLEPKHIMEAARCPHPAWQVNEFKTCFSAALSQSQSPQSSSTSDPSPSAPGAAASSSLMSMSSSSLSSAGSDLGLAAVPFGGACACQALVRLTFASSPSKNCVCSWHRSMQGSQRQTPPVQLQELQSTFKGPVQPLQLSAGGLRPRFPAAL